MQKKTKTEATSDILMFSTTSSQNEPASLRSTHIYQRVSSCNRRDRHPKSVFVALSGILFEPAEGIQRYSWTLKKPRIARIAGSTSTCIRIFAALNAPSEQVGADSEDLSHFLGGVMSLSRQAEGV
jgi:hypothetical protein